MRSCEFDASGSQIAFASRRAALAEMNKTLSAYVRDAAAKWKKIKGCFLLIIKF